MNLPDLPEMEWSMRVAEAEETFRRPHYASAPPSDLRVSQKRLSYSDLAQLPAHF